MAMQRRQNVRLLSVFFIDFILCDMVYVNVEKPVKSSFVVLHVCAVYNTMIHISLVSLDSKIQSTPIGSATQKSRRARLPNFVVCPGSAVPDHH